MRGLSFSTSIEWHRIVVALLFFTCFSVYMATNVSVVLGYDPMVTLVDVSFLTDNLLTTLPTAFAILIGISCSPFIALTVLSGAGIFLNSGLIDPSRIPFSEALIELPIAQTNFFIILLTITLIKGALSLAGTTKIFCDVILGKIESIFGTICAILGAYFLTFATTVYATEITYTAGSGIWATVVTGIISFSLALLAYIIYFVMKTLVFAIGILALLASPIVGFNALFTVSKHIIVVVYTWYALVRPQISSVVGVICLILAIMFFRWARRIILYYRKIYLSPLFNFIFRNDYKVPTLPKRLPRCIVREFANVDICIEAFFMNKTSIFYKRELCYFIKSDDSNYLFKKRFLGKVIRIRLEDDIYIEKCFRFIRIFTDEGSHINYRKIHIVLTREHSINKAVLMSKANLINYNTVLEERRRIANEETMRKILLITSSVKSAFIQGNKKLNGIFNKSKNKKTDS